EDFGMRIGSRFESGRDAAPLDAASAVTRFDVAWRSVQRIHAATAAANAVRRSPPAASGGSCASFSAIPAWNGLVGPNAEPIIAAPALMATTVVPSTRIRRPRTTRART